MNINTSAPFQLNWNRSISVETESSHHSTAFTYHLATVVTAVAFVALFAIASIMFPEFATLLILGVFVLSSPGIELCKHFLSKAQEAKKLEEQAIKVRECYQKFIEKKESNPEIKALSCHWKEKSVTLHKAYLDIHQKAVEKGKEPQNNDSSASLRKYRLDSLEAQKTAAKVQVYALFLESLISNQAPFEKAFLKHGEKLSHSILEFGTWDERETEKRAMDPRFTEVDPLLGFHNVNITPISYSEIYQDSSRESLKTRLFEAFIESQNAS